MADDQQEKKLTDKEEAFCQSYLVDFNGAKAARTAGYSPDSAKEIACENLTKPHIQARIHQLRAEMGKAYNVTRERIAQELARIGFSDIRNLFDEKGALKTPENWSDEDAAAVASVETDELFEGFGREREQVGLTKKVKVWEKTKALEALCRLMGYNEPDKKELSGSIDIKQIQGMNVT